MRYLNIVKCIDVGNEYIMYVNIEKLIVLIFIYYFFLISGENCFWYRFILFFIWGGDKVVEWSV